MAMRVEGGYFLELHISNICAHPFLCFIIIIIFDMEARKGGTEEDGKEKT